MLPLQVMQHNALSSGFSTLCMTKLNFRSDYRRFDGIIFLFDFGGFIPIKIIQTHPPPPPLLPQNVLFFRIFYPQVEVVLKKYCSCEARKNSEACYKRTGKNARKLFHQYVCLSVAHFCVQLFERTIKASDFRFAAKCRH